MALPSRRGFARLLQRLDRPSLEAFLSALWTARGRSVRTVGGRIVATRPDGRETVIALHSSGSGGVLPSDADVVVTTTTGVAQSLDAECDARVFDPADLRGMVLYGIERERADALFRRFFDRPLEGRAVEDARRLPRTGLTVAVVLSVVLVVAGVALPPGSGTGRSDAGSGARETDGVPTTRSPTEPEYETLAPGLTSAGVSDVNALATAHAAALDGTAYTWSITYREHGQDDRFRLVAGRNEVVAVTDERHYSSSVYAWGELHSVSPTDDVSTYANGTARYVRSVTPDDETNDTDDTPVWVEPVAPSGDGFATRAGRYVRWYLSANQTAVRTWRTRRGLAYLVTATGSPYPGARNYTAMAVVNATGFVRQLRAEYEIPGTQVAVIVTFRYTDLGETTVEPPAWIRETAGKTDSRTDGTDAPTAERGVDSPRPQANASHLRTGGNAANDVR